MVFKGANIGRVSITYTSGTAGKKIRFDYSTSRG
jgi:hypothetical protein